MFPCCIINSAQCILCRKYWKVGESAIDRRRTDREKKHKEARGIQNHHNVQRHGSTLQSIEETDVYFDNPVSSHWICYRTSGQRFRMLDWLCSVRQIKQNIFKTTSTALKKKTHLRYNTKCCIRWIQISFTCYQVNGKPNIGLISLPGS